jgi:SAM-dependent methyltransferase
MTGIGWRAEFIDILTELETWYGREAGQHLLQQTRDALREPLAAAFGYHLVQVGEVRGQPLWQGSRINHRVYAAPRAGIGTNLVCNGDELPLDSDSVDALILHHALEFSERPHELLREAQRVLTPRGILLVVGFNPWSVHGVSTRLRALSSDSLWRRQRFVSESRLSDWLHLLGFDMQSSRSLEPLPVRGGQRLQRWLQAANRWHERHALPLGNIYVSHAVKQVARGIRDRRRLQSPRRLIGLAVPKPVVAPSPSTGVHRDGDSAA